MRRSLVFLAALAILAGCNKENDDPGEGTVNPPDGPSGSVSYLTIADGCARTVLGGDLDEGFVLKINGAVTEAARDNDGRWYIPTPEEAVTEGSIVWNNDRTIPFSLFQGKVQARMKHAPLRFEKRSGDNLLFLDECSLVDLELAGSASVTSVRLASPDGLPVASGLDFSVVNCIAENGLPTLLPAHFLIPVKAGHYPSGFSVTVCDNTRKMQQYLLPGCTLEPGEVLPYKGTYSPDTALLFYDGFDNCVWGGGPGNLAGYAPDNTFPNDEAYANSSTEDNPWRTGLTGYEEARFHVPAETPGSSFFQKNKWETGNTVASAHTMSASFIASRNLGDWKILFRAREYLGCISVGIGNNFRGLVETPPLRGLTETSAVTLSFRVWFRDSIIENLELLVQNGGTITRMEVDGQTEMTSPGVTSCICPAAKLTGGWHRVQYTVQNATATTSFRVQGSVTDSGRHGWWMDDILVRKAGAIDDQPEAMSALTGLNTVRYSFKLSFAEGAKEGINFSLPTGGMIAGLSIDGQRIPDGTFGKTDWLLKASHQLDRALIGSGTHTVSYIIESADSGTTIRISGPSAPDGTQLFTLSDTAVDVISSQQRGNFRILYWNIQNGMWADQGAAYAHFKEWIQRYSPDMCVWCEGGSYLNNAGTGNSSSRYFPNGWSEFAAGYGHQNVVTSAIRDNFPQIVTTKYPISTLESFSGTGTSRPIWHGAAHHRFNTLGRTIDLVTCHPWPFSYSYEARGTADESASAARKEGDYYREFELKYLMDHTVKDADYASVSDWIFLGDMNSVSRADAWFYTGLSSDDSAYLAQDVLRSSLVDVIEARFPGRFFPTTGAETKRIDYIYLSPSLCDKVKDVIVITDSWTHPTFTGISNYWSPSDHRPILLDLDL